MSREAHVRFYEGRGVRLPSATHLLGLEVEALAKRRARGVPPAYLKLGASPKAPVRYRRSALEALLVEVEPTHEQTPRRSARRVTRRRHVRR